MHWQYFSIFLLIILVTFILFSSTCDRSYWRQWCIWYRFFTLKCIVTSALTVHHNSSKYMANMYRNGHEYTVLPAPWGWRQDFINLA